MFSSIKGIVSSVSSTVSSTITSGSSSIQNMKETVVQLPSQTKEYFYPTQHTYEMKSVVRLNDNFIIQTDIEDYPTPAGINHISNNPHKNSSKLIKPSNDAISIQSWHEFDLCVDDETLFDTETGSFFTGNYSLNTGNIYSESDDNIVDCPIPPEFNFRQSLNLMEENPEQLFKDLYQFRKSIIAIRKKSGIAIVNTVSTAPPTDRSTGSYERRVCTLDNNGVCAALSAPETGQSLTSISIAQPSPQSISILEQKLHREVFRSIEGSRDFGVDEISAICVKGTSTPQRYSVTEEDVSQTDEHKKQASIGFVMHRTKSQVFASGDITFISAKCQPPSPALSTVESEVSAKVSVVGHTFLSNVDSDDYNRTSALISPMVSVSPIGREEEEEEEDGDDDFNEEEFKQMENLFSVQRSLSEPRGSMKVEQISMSSDMRDTLIHQRSISQAAAGAPSLPSKSGLDPQHATVTVIDEDTSTIKEIDDDVKYDDVVQHLNKIHHTSNSSMDTQPTINPLLVDTDTTIIKMNYMDDIKEEDDEMPEKLSITDLPSQASCFAYDDDDDEDNLSVIRKLTMELDIEGAELDSDYNTGISSIINHPQEEKFAELLSSEYDGYDENAITNANGLDSMMTLGGHMLNVLKHIPWQENDFLPQELDESFGERHFPRFPISPIINQIIRIWDGDPIMNCDAIVIPITENWTAVNQSSHSVMNIAGSKYLEYIYQQKKIKDYVCTGDVKSIPSFNLPCNYIIHTAPPCYNDRFPVASENAMNSCYWRSLELATDLKCKSIVLLPLCPPNLYSQHLSIHILARTLRRFLEQSTYLQSVVICIENHAHLQLYMRIITVYFPRDNIDLKYSHKYIPAYTGNIYGGTDVRIRKQNIELSPLTFLMSDYCASLASDSKPVFGKTTIGLLNNNGIYIKSCKQIDYETYDIYGNLRPGIQKMVECKELPEKIWKQSQYKKWRWQIFEESLQIKYQRYWNRSRNISLKEIEIHQFCYIGGTDNIGRDIIIFVGCRFPGRKLFHIQKLKRALLYVIRELHHIVKKEYIIIYLHSLVDEEENLPPVSWIHECFQIVSNHFSKKLYRFFIIHPTFRLKSWFYILSQKVFWKKILYLDSVYKLEQFSIDLENIALPGKCWEYERELYGEEYLADKMASDDLLLDAMPYR